jgi:hypothetical protein
VELEALLRNEISPPVYPVDVGAKFRPTVALCPPAMVKGNATFANEKLALLEVIEETVTLEL